MREQASPRLGPGIIARIEELGQISETPDALTRVYLSSEHRRAGDLLAGWMREAGMSARVDAIGNVVGRYEGEESRRPALLLGSHYDTVRDAGKWDGPLGIVTAIACVAELNRRGKRLPFAIEVIAFADEEGVRFASTLLGSRAVAGTFDEGTLRARDSDGVSLREAMQRFGLDPDHIGAAARAPGEFLGYIELHIEQGPVLEAQALPVGVVSAISGATRLNVTLEGMAGHAGTVPMAMRHDALTGAAECIVAIETQCRNDIGLFGTVGYLRADPGASNVIPGRVIFTIDMRCASDEHRRLAVASAVKTIERIAETRGLRPQIDVTHEGRSVPCASWLATQISEAIVRCGFAPMTLPSGAGHDGMAIADITDIGMIFVRCRGGVSHHPDEHVDDADVETGARVLLDVIENFRDEGRKKEKNNG
ncbi:allantoate amidohydrolase [Bradyrhizobium guangdongense]|uniref:allantoate amidohydrolase n=1 Tax=Bradyrhizobium guangdongense TaxID=1325090 RepID=UPI00112E53EC|nr:allantoate amidohydrolase [Bradyrhizobium guangdongense]TPQ40828.1 allantoate amidohydrolase [Bradyrhizobium guangdongense]